MILSTFGLLSESHRHPDGASPCTRWMALWPGCAVASTVWPNKVTVRVKHAYNHWMHRSVSALIKPSKGPCRSQGNRLSCLLSLSFPEMREGI